jgi:hypothetical protein
VVRGQRRFDSVVERHRREPPRVDKSLTGRCELLSFWYTVDRAPDIAALANAVAGELEGAWRSPPDSVLCAMASAGATGIRSSRAVVVARSANYPDAPVDYGLSYAPSGQPSLSGEAAKLAEIAAPAPDSVDSLVAWVQAARGLPLLLRSAALTVADLAMPQLAARSQAGGPEWAWRRYRPHGASRRPLLMIVKVREAYVHCSRALVRADLWNPAKFAAAGTVPTFGALMEAHTCGMVKADVVDEEAKTRVPLTLY